MERPAWCAHVNRCFCRVWILRYPLVCLPLLCHPHKLSTARRNAWGRSRTSMDRLLDFGADLDWQAALLYTRL